MPERIDALLPEAVRARIEALRVEWSLESTNTRLLESLPPAAGVAAVILAEHQTGGRGRRGRGWIAPPGRRDLPVAGVAVPGPAGRSVGAQPHRGMAAVAALASSASSGVRLKWPNDLVTARGKLGGILIEMRAEAGGPVHLVIGLGLNVHAGCSRRGPASSHGQRGRRSARLAVRRCRIAMRWSPRCWRS